MPPKRESSPMPNIRPEVAEVVRRAARIAFVNSYEPMRLDELATALDEDGGLTPQVLKHWAREEDWEGLRAQALAADVLARGDAERRRQEARAGVESLQRHTYQVQRVLRPKTWEAAASLNLRCQETLRGWAEDDYRRARPVEEAAGEEGAAAPVPEPEMDEETWQRMAHIALSTPHHKKKDPDDGHIPPDGGAGDPVLPGA